ncbi:MAG: ABC transporter permease [Vicinamibacterales bacterium]
MLSFLLRRVATALPVLAGVAIAVFLLIHLVPGDPAVSMLGEGASPADVAALRERLGLDRPLPEQFIRYTARLMQGDMGQSFRYGTPVTKEIASRLGFTILLAGCALTVALTIAFPLGVLAAVFRGRPADVALSLCALVGVSLPAFWLGPLLALVFAVRLGWLPVSGAGSVAHLVLPSLTLGTSLAAVLARLVRSSVSDELAELYVVAARARGASSMRAVGHAVRNSLIPIVTIIGLQVGAVLTGSIVTETIFAWPGVGRLLVQAIGFRDYPLVQGCILFVALVYVVVNLLTDVVYGWLDPRVRVVS